MSQKNACANIPRRSTTVPTFSGNPEQQAAYNATGSCIILAGPGSGKTHTLVHKIFKTLKEDVFEPHRIACITYSRQCVRELKRRLKSLGINEGKRISIETMHSFCLKHILLPFGLLANVDIPRPIIVASGKEIDSLKKLAINNCGLNSYWSPALDAYRRTYIDRESNEWLEKDEQYASIIEEYERLLISHGFIDYDKMVLSGLEMINKNSWIRSALLAQFPVLFVDEYQDLGVALHEMVKILCLESNMRLIAVGDPDQSIYGFTGANPGLLKELADNPNFEKVELKMNYRCGRSIISASEVALGESRGCSSNMAEQGDVFFHERPAGIEDQVMHVCNSIIPNFLVQNKRFKLGDIGILYIDKNDGDVIAKEVAQQGWDFIRVDGNSPYQPSSVTYWLEECAAWCSGGWKLGDPSLSSLTRQWIFFNESLHSDSEKRSAQVNLVQFLYQNKGLNGPLHLWLSSFLSHCLALPLNRELRLRDDKEKVDRLLDAVSPGNPLSAFTVESFSGQGRSANHLNLTTLHSAKGLEFEVVIILGLEQGRIPWTTDGPGALSERRRLFYVGLTRARREIHLVYSGHYIDRKGRQRSYGPSQFVLEIQRSIQMDC